MKTGFNTNPVISLLLVEDEATTLEILTIILAKKFPDITLYTANNGRTGLELFNVHTPNIVITDINMPDIGGVMLTIKIRALKIDTKFIALTGNSDKLILQDSGGIQFEYDHFIVKPVDFQELFAAIEQCLGEIACSPARIPPKPDYFFNQP